MKKFKSLKLTVFIIVAFFFSCLAPAYAGSFIATSDGIRYVYQNSNGEKVYVNPKYDTQTGTYYVVNSNNQVIAQQNLSSEADMNQIKIITPTGSNATTQDFMGNEVQIMTPMATADPRYQQLKRYIESNDSVKKTVSMQIQARNYKIQKIQQQVSEGVKDESLAAWLTNDLKKPVYLAVDNS
ncbi:MAG: hypothetical protein J6Z11_09335 [Candidatus Riflebacteria bacterium]|nr:hypothetical protein [Candidatus Riflebacteria bacterium]